MESVLPIFSKSRKNFNPTTKITHLAVSNMNLVVAMADNVLFRVDYQHQDAFHEITFSKFTQRDRLHNLYLDPSGNHLLLNFMLQSNELGRELYYLPKSSKKIRCISKLRGHDITEVAWNYHSGNELTTGPILLGSSKGIIMEVEIQTAENAHSLTSQLPMYVKQLIDFGNGKNLPITGLAFFQIPEQSRALIFVCTPQHFYYLSGNITNEEKPMLQQLFARYLTILPDVNIPLPENNQRSRLRCWSDSTNVPTSFAVVTDKEIIYCQFDYNTCKSSRDISISRISYPTVPHSDTAVSVKPPHSFVLTEFHVLLAYPDRMRALFLLNKSLVYDDPIDCGEVMNTEGRVVSLCRDTTTGAIWSATENSIYKILVRNENRDVWKIYCDQGDYERALNHTQESSTLYDYVLLQKAKSLFKDGNYIDSADYFARSQSSSFEEICLKYLQLDHPNALTLFLRKKMEYLPVEDKMQTTMIILWIIELFLSDLEVMKLDGMRQTSKFADLQHQFESFLQLEKVANCILENKSTVYRLMDCHGETTNKLILASINNDHDVLIQQHICNRNYIEALNVIKSQSNKQFYYHFAPVLLPEIPNLVVTVLIQKGGHLSSTELLPALMSHRGQKQALEVIRYLEFCVNKLNTHERAIHNYLLSLYVEHDETKLLHYLDIQGKHLLEVQYDVIYALRLCQEKGVKRACVHLTCLLGLWESSVDLALTINESLAKEIANQVDENDIQLRKKLWLKIAKHVVSAEKDIKEAMKSLHECDLLRIEDILPFCPDFETIDHFKAAICDSLKEYNQNIQDLKDEMEEATLSSEEVRQSIQSFRSRHTTIKVDDKCDLCERPLLVRAFYMFPCLHRFHMDCMQSELIPSLGSRKQTKLEELHKQLHTLTLNTDTISTHSNVSAKDIQSEIDNIVASECLFCGEIMIRNIDKHFIEDKDYERVFKDWD